MLYELTSIIMSWVTALTFADKAVLVFVLLFHRIMAMLGMWTYALFTLLGTLFHEFLHWFFAFVLGANPSFPNLIPEKHSTGWRLGSVRFSPGLLRNIPIALAPFLLAPFGLWWSMYYMHPATGWWYFGHAWVAGTLIMASLPSGQDWKIAAPALFICATGWLVYYFSIFVL